MPHTPRLLSVGRIGFGLLLLGAAYAWWVNAQYERLNAVNQLELEDAGAELKRALENAKETVNRFEPSDEAMRRSEEPACVFDAQQPYLEFDGSCSAEKGFKYERAVLSTSRGLAVESGRLVANPKNTSAQKLPKEPARWRFQLDALIEELAFSDALELVFVADDAGTVLYQATPRQRQWRRMLRWGERTFEDSGALETGGLRIQNLTSMLGKDAVPGWTRLHAVSDNTTVSIGGESHQLYVQPVAGGSDMGVRLALGAIVPTQRILRRALAIDTYFIALLVVIFLLGLLGLPFLKLVAMSAHERFRIRDVYGLYVSCAALLTLATFIVLGIDTYARWTHVADEGLARMADDLERRVTREVRDIRNQLIGYDAIVAWRSPGSPCSNPMVLAHWFEYGPSGNPRDVVLKRNTDVFIDQATWIDPKGQQIWKITSDQIAVNRNVAKRPYFSAVRSGHLYRDATSPWPFFVAPDRSITDGKFYTFLSIPSMLDDACASTLRRAGADEQASPQSGYVAVASTRLLSVEHASLPFGYGFALVTRDGRVLYHSDSRLGLRENLFDHLDKGDLARAIAQSGRKESLSASYREVAHRLQFNPLPWSLAGGPEDLPLPDRSAGLVLVAFRDVSTERAIVARAFVVSLGPMLLLVAGLGVGLGMAALFSRRRQGGWARWLWPHGGLSPMYKVMAISVGCVLVGFVATIEALAGAWPYLILPACAAAPGLAVYSRGSWHAAPRRALDGYGWYTTELTLLALGMIVVPASAVFNLTLGHEFGVLIRTEQQRMDTQAVDARLALRAEARAREFPESVGAEAAGAHTLRQIGPFVAGQASPPLRPAPYDVRPSALSTGDYLIVGIHEWFDSLLPAGSALLARLRYGDFGLRYLPPGRLGPLSWWGAAGIVGIIVLLAAWVRWSAIHLHAADITPAAPVPDDEVEAVWDTLTENHKHVLLQATEEHIANPRQRAAVAWLAHRGLLKLSPDIQPATSAVHEFLERVRRAEHYATRLRDWERTHEGHSWQKARPLLLVSLVVVAAFLAITQPGLQSNLVTMLSGAAAIGASGIKLRDAFTAWLGKSAG